MHKPALVVICALLMASCASAPEKVGATRAPSQQAVQGMAFAQARCSGRHAIGEIGESPRANAPPFRVLRVRLNTITWERTLADIAKGGHNEMPPLALDSADVSDVQAYIETLH